MKIEKDSVVRFHYTVSELGQEPIESSKERDPLAILIGHGNIIPGLEAAMMDKEAGESIGVDDGATVTAGTVVVTVEAMKMEHALSAPVDGVVELLVGAGEQVKVGQVLARITATKEPQA